MVAPAEQRVCPSSPLEYATHLLGVVGRDGRIHYVSPALPLDDDFRVAASRRGKTGARLRLSGPCLESGCQQWTGSRCGVIEDVLEETADVDLDTELRPCTIRRDCRWFAQQGAAACHVCPLVVTDSRT
jgi:hypothetical protein